MANLEFKDTRECIKYSVKNHMRRVVLFPFIESDYSTHAEKSKKKKKPMIYEMVMEFFKISVECRKPYPEI